MQTILDITGKHEVDNYPYGRLKTKAFFSIEFKKGKGFRSVFQTINPKNGRLNAVKNGTYSTFMYNVLNHENGHIQIGNIHFNDFDSINRAAKFIVNNQEALKLTSEMMYDITMSMLSVSKISAKYTPVDFELLKPLISASVEAMVDMIKTGNYDFSKIYFDVNAIELLKSK